MRGLRGVRGVRGVRVCEGMCEGVKEGMQGGVRLVPCFDEVVVTDFASCPPPAIR